VLILFSDIQIRGEDHWLPRNLDCSLVNFDWGADVMPTFVYINIRSAVCALYLPIDLYLELARAIV
jgi:hypothetical protein